MRFIKKYKQYQRVFTLSSSFPARLLKFKRPKWFKLQKFIKTNNKKTQESIKINNIILKPEFKTWSKIKTQYKDGLLLKRVIFLFFDNSITISFFKREFNLYKNNKYNAFISTFIKLLFRLDILLWKLNIFDSSFAAKQKIYAKKIKKNFANLSKVPFVRKGDVISIPHLTCTNLVEKNFVFLYSFIELDTYTNTIVVLKDFNDFNQEDLFLLLEDHITIKKFIDYIKK